MDSQPSHAHANPRPWASVIIPVWNGRAYLADCLDALLAQEPAGFEVIAVDNASTDGSADLIAADYPGVRLIRNPDNLGFAGGCNVGLKAAGGEVLVLLNQDTRVCKGWLEALVHGCQEPKVGAVGCKALYPDGCTIQHAGGRIEWPMGVGSHLGAEQPDADEWNLARPVDYVTGAAMAFRRQVLDEVGPLDEGFWPGYYEDVDFCYRVREAGYEVWYVPAARLIHDESAGLSGTRARQVALHRGRLRFVLKHLPPQRFLTEFVPAERAQFLPLARGEVGQALRRVYIEAVPAAAGVLARHTKCGARDVDDVLNALLRLYQDAAPDPMPVKPELDELVFASSVPLFGPLIAGLRSLWYNVAARWAVRHLARQQAAINLEYRLRIEEQEALNVHTVRALVALSREVACLVRQIESERDDHG